MAWYFLFQYTMGRVIFTQPTPAPEIEKRIVIIICFLQTKERKREKKIKFFPLLILSYPLPIIIHSIIHDWWQPASRQIQSFDNNDKGKILIY